MTSTETSKSPTKPTPKKSGKPRRKNRKPHELAVDSILRMPLGELARTADYLAESDEETARFFLSKLQQRIEAEDRRALRQSASEVDDRPAPPTS